MFLFSPFVAALKFNLGISPNALVEYLLNCRTHKKKKNNLNVFRIFAILFLDKQSFSVIKYSLKLAFFFNSSRIL